MLSILPYADEAEAVMRAGNGREYGKWALDEFCEVKAVIGYEAA